MSSRAVNLTRAMALSWWVCGATAAWMASSSTCSRCLSAAKATGTKTANNERIKTRLRGRAAVCILERTPALQVTINDEKSTWKDALRLLTLMIQFGEDGSRGTAARIVI